MEEGNGRTARLEIASVGRRMRGVYMRLPRIFGIYPWLLLSNGIKLALGVPVKSQRRGGLIQS